jgi:hypothetical protein
MPRPLRLLFPHTVTLLTSRVQQGLPFVHTPLMETILWSALALAQDSHNIKIIFILGTGLLLKQLWNRLHAKAHKPAPGGPKNSLRFAPGAQ